MPRYKSDCEFSDVRDRMKNAVETAIYQKCCKVASKGRCDEKEMFCARIFSRKFYSTTLATAQGIIM
jgi:hypothetical protein